MFSVSGIHVGGDRFSDVGSRTVREPTAVGDRLGVFVGYGQSNSDCCGSGPNPEVLSGNSIFNFYAGSNGSTFEYEEPMLGAYCRGSCPYLKVGNGLIEAGGFDEVVFSTAGMPGAPLGSLNGGLEEYPWFGFLVESYLGMKEKYGKVDGILFHQGESNVGLSSTYENEFDLFLENLAAQGIAVGDGVGEVKIYVSRTTKCGAGEDEELREVQLGLAGKEGVVEGPNTDTISTDTFYRYDGCHFSQAGWDKVAELWMEKLVV
ncbi:hypothetical protein TL16_g05918 [Triparma laevis f. inornata]|uniref:Sialate O-acetylesterase domain-containing protein n=1 Tax=Triparma laevis f. inornata TaxID=1714386 RepID=A0A9W7AM75_9STRA|nr:hypothetical protein TL16_g05918 [Triparma laevis f. inornata]